MFGAHAAGVEYQPSMTSADQRACVQADKSNFAAYSKVRGLLTSASEELPDVPLYYNLHTMCKTLRVTPPGNSTIRSAIVNAGESICTSYNKGCRVGMPCMCAGSCLYGVDITWDASGMSQTPRCAGSMDAQGRKLQTSCAVVLVLLRLYRGPAWRHSPHLPPGILAERMPRSMAEACIALTAHTCSLQGLEDAP